MCRWWTYLGYRRAKKYKIAVLKSTDPISKFGRGNLGLACAGNSLCACPATTVDQYIPQGPSTEIQAGWWLQGRSSCHRTAYTLHIDPKKACPEGGTASPLSSLVSGARKAWRGFFPARNGGRHWNTVPAGLLNDLVVGVGGRQLVCVLTSRTGRVSVLVKVPRSDVLVEEILLFRAYYFFLLMFCGMQSRLQPSLMARTIPVG